ncbi:pyridine nucleotide-disulfide oxidoreductase domain-containing protein 2, partial [Anaerolineaceae bacterium]
MAKRYDAIIVGGGHNGLVAAAYLARAGREVLVLGAAPSGGGATVTEELVPRLKYSVFSYVVSLLRPEIMRDLSLARHGLEILPLESTFTHCPGGTIVARAGPRADAPRDLPALPARCGRVRR